MFKLSSPQQIQSLHILLPGQARRAELEQFVAHHYARVYGARLTQFMPVLLGLFDAVDQPFAVMGLRPARNEALYLEQYLDYPVEQTLACAARQPVARSQIIELGHFAVARPDAALWIMLLATAYLKASGAGWACMTVIPVLQKALRRMGLQPLHLADVDASRLLDTQNQWGTYYQQRPQVIADQVERSFQVILANLQASIYWQNGLDRLWENAYEAGIAA